MVNYPASYYPAQRLIANYPTVGSPMAGTRNLIKFGNFLELNGVFEQVATATTTAPVTTVKGNFNIQQNGILDVFSGSEAKFSMYIMSSNDLTGKNIKVNLGTGASCLAASQGTLVELAMVNAPPLHQRILHQLRHHGLQHRRDEQQDGLDGFHQLAGPH